LPTRRSEAIDAWSDAFQLSKAFKKIGGGLGDTHGNFGSSARGRFDGGVAALQLLGTLLGHFEGSKHCI